MSDQDNNDPTRRDVLASVGAAGAAVAIDALATSAQAQPKRTPHVIIVGAGLAGLCAAYELQQKNWTYTILEADRLHAGGRVRTMKMGQLSWEAGAMRIPEEHKRALDYVDAFKLKRRPFVMNSAKTFKFARNTKAINEDDIKRLYNLTAAEKMKSAFQLWEIGVKNFSALGGKHGLTQGEQEELRTANKFTLDRLIKYDGLSLRQLIQTARLDPTPEDPTGKPLSDEVIEFLLFANGNLAIQQGAATEFLREENIGVWDKDFFRIEGGTSELPNAFINRLTKRPKMGCEVVRLEQKRGKVTAHYRTAAGPGKEEGDFLLCTIPFPVLAGVEADPPFSHDKRRAIVEMNYDSGTKVAVMTKNRFWEKNSGIYGGSTTTDLMSGAIIYPSDNAKNKDGVEPIDPAVSDRPGVFLASYCWGQDARRLGAMPPSQREDTVIRMISDIHPELRERGMVIQKTSWAWDTYRWSLGTFAFYLPGQFQRMHEIVVRPEGLIYFAGEHCSHSHSWMEGALELARMAVDALEKRAG